MPRSLLQALNRRIVTTLFAVLAALMCLVMLSSQALAEETVCYLGEAVDAGKDTGYSESNAISKSSPHFGWDLGTFYVSGFTSKQKSKDGTFTFLKTVDDKLELHFRLDQDIDALNGNSNLTVSNDTDGYDEEMGIGKTEEGFGRGTIIVRQTNYDNSTSEPQVYVNYFEGIEQGADTVVQLFEEGDYEVALDYELKNDVRNLFGKVSILPSYTNYTIRFTFSVRNGNTMVFLLDSETGSELANSSTTTNGFIIDLAQSRYLDINVKREVLSDNGTELVADTRQNGPAKDGEVYTEPGVYTITAKNQTTGETTTKIINVGDDPVLEEYANEGGNISIAEIQSQFIETEGAETEPAGEKATETDAAVAESEQAGSSSDQTGATGMAALVFVIVLIVAMAAGIAVFIIQSKKKHVAAAANKNDTPAADESEPEEGNED